MTKILSTSFNASPFTLVAQSITSLARKFFRDCNRVQTEGQELSARVQFDIGLSDINPDRAASHSSNMRQNLDMMRLRSL
jgi:hypothetical protein